MTTYAGDFAVALHTADSIALSRSYARRFFGRDAPLGETLIIDGHPMVVRAVFPDQAQEHAPATTSSPRVFPAMRRTSTVEHDVLDKMGQLLVVPGITYVRLRPGTDVASVTSNLQQLLQPTNLGRSPFMPVPELIRIDRFNTHEALHPGLPQPHAAAGDTGRRGAADRGGQLRQSADGSLGAAGAERPRSVLWRGPGRHLAGRAVSR